MHNYSCVITNENYPNQWFLCDFDIKDIERIPQADTFYPARTFKNACLMDTPNVTVIVYKETVRRLNWHNSEFNVPIIDYPVWELLSPMIQDDVQAIPCDVEGVEEKFILLNLLNKIDCIDEQKSQVVYIPEQEKQESIARGDSYIRKYRDVSNLTIDPTRVGDHKLFWTKHWPAQIIRNDVRDAFLAAGFKGPSFIPV